MPSPWQKYPLFILIASLLRLSNICNHYVHHITGRPDRRPMWDNNISVSSQTLRVVFLRTDLSAAPSAVGESVSSCLSCLCLPCMHRIKTITVSKINTAEYPKLEVKFQRDQNGTVFKNGGWCVICIHGEWPAQWSYAKMMVRHYQH